MSYSCRVRRTVCVATLAAAFAGATGHRAQADDGTPQLPDAAAIVATAEAATISAPETPQTVVVPVVSVPIPPTVPAPTPVSVPVDAPSADPAPVPQPAADTNHAVPGAPATPSPAPHSDDGNTAGDNSSGITNQETNSTPTAPGQTLVWNWYWNCDGVPSTPEPPPTPDPTAGAVTIVWNWQWDCPDAPPPAASVTGSTICVGCNINISVRVGSPGDSGDVTQTTGTDSNAIAANVATATQAAAQILPEAAPQQPAVPPPAPPVPVVVVPQVPPLLPVAAVPAGVASSVIAAAAVGPTVAGSVAAVTPVRAVDAGGDDTPRHGAPEFAIDPGRASSPGSAAPARDPARAFASSAVRAVSVVPAGSVAVKARPGKAAARSVPKPERGGRAPRPFPPVPSRTPAPLAIGHAPTETHDTGGFTTFALGASALGAFLLGLLGYVAPGLQTVRSRPGLAHPDPPG